MKKFQQKIFDIFLIFAKNIECGYTRKPPHRGGSKVYPQSMFWSKNKKNRYTPAYIDCGYMLEPPGQGGSNKYPHSMFWSKNKRMIIKIPAYPSFAI